MEVLVVPFASCMRDPEEMRVRQRKYLDDLGRMGKEIGISFRLDSEAGVREGSDPRCELLLVESGGTEQAALAHIAKMPAGGIGIILAHDADNALAAALEISAIARLRGVGLRIVQARRGWQEEISGLLRLAEVRSVLASARLGVLGVRDIEVMPKWDMERAVRNVWGPEVLHLDMAELAMEMECASRDEVEGAAFDLQTGARDIVEPDAKSLSGAAQIYAGLRRIVERKGLSAVAVKCFDLLESHGNTGCYALARLNEEGVAAACEADVLSAVAMLFMMTLTEEPVFMANPSWIDPACGEMCLAHCTIARSMCARHALRTHYESGIGVGIAGTVDPGPVTVMRIGGNGLDEVFVAEAELLECGDREDLCRTQLTIRLDDPELAEEMLRAPLGNHHIVALGDWRRQVVDYAELFLHSPLS